MKGVIPMKRDMDLIRLLLLQIEGEERLDLSEYPQEQILYHKNLLLEANLAQGKCLPGNDKIVAVSLTRLTWDGHDFLNAIKNETVWDKTRKVLKDKGGEVSFEIVKNLAMKFAMEIFGLG